MLGVGFEHQMAPNWRLSAEYLYLDFGSINGTGAGAFAAGLPYSIAANQDHQFHIARVKLNYNWGAGADSAYAAYASARPAKPAAQPVYSWTGWYAGINGGFGWSNDGITIAEEGGAALGGPGTNYASPSVRTRPEGALFGGQIGYNWHNGMVLWGIEADIQWSDIDGAVTVGPITTLAGPFTGTTVASTELEWFGTLRGRLGITPWQTTLLYVTGGLAYGKINTSVNTTARFAGLVANAGFSVSDKENGWALGAGFEHQMAPNWRLSAEYIYLDFGSINGTGAGLLLPDFRTALRPIRTTSFISRG